MHFSMFPNGWRLSIRLGRRRLLTLDWIRSAEKGTWGWGEWLDGYAFANRWGSLWITMRRIGGF